MVQNGAAKQIFGHGFARREQDDEAFAKCPMRRFIAVLHTVAIACGLADGLGERRLHAFRVMAENRMGQLGIGSLERADYVGWQSTTQQTSYSLMKSRALNSVVPYVIAGRENKDAPPHAMWGLLDEVPSSVVGYWHRVNYLAVAAKTIKGSVTIDAAFQEQMDVYLRLASEKKADSANPKLLLKRIRDLERDVQTERSKRARLELLMSAAQEPSISSNISVDSGSTTTDDDDDDD